MQKVRNVLGRLAHTGAGQKMKKYGIITHGPALFKIEDICCLRITSMDLFCNGLSSWLNLSTFKT